MARIRSLGRSARNFQLSRTEVDCEYLELRGDDGTPVLILATFGSDARQSKPKVSQTIQFDQSLAEELLEVMLRTFPGLRK